MRRILIVDDEHIVAETLRLIFEKNGFRTCKAHSAVEAMERAVTFAPDLLLCDLNMPGKDGAALITELVEVYPVCRVLVLTGTASGGSKVMELSGALHREVAVVFKPCPPRELLRMAEAMLAA